MTTVTMRSKELQGERAAEECGGKGQWQRMVEEFERG